MTIYIDEEAKRHLRSPMDIERWGDRYKTSNNLYSFPSPNLSTIDKNLFYLLRNSSTIKFEPKYKYRPDYLSYDQYGSTTLWELLMYVNSVFSVEEFDLDTVVIPSMEAIIFSLQDLFPEREPSDLQTVTW